MFIGEYTHNLDQKGRLAVPAKFRQRLADGAIITRGLDRCLFAYTRSDWEILAGKLAQLPISQADARAFARHILSGAMEVGLDAQGRILIPDYLRDYANLSKRTILAGLYNRIEVWNEKIWAEYKDRTERASDSIAEKMGELGI